MNLVKGIFLAFYDATIGPNDHGVLSGPGRNRRSLLTYLAQGGPLAPYYIDSENAIEKES